MMSRFYRTDASAGQRTALLKKPPHRAKSFRRWKMARISFLREIREGRGEN